MKLLREIFSLYQAFLKNGTRTEKQLFAAFSFATILLFLYSFTQVDLSLTLSRVSSWQGIQKAFQYIGYFNRPLSSLLFILLLIFLFCLFIMKLTLIYRRKIGKIAVFGMIGLTTIILSVAYNAFSYDLFNYIFDAKIITYYHQSPYTHKALDFQGDPMLSFMHWTHRVYPYGPSWLVLTVPFSFLGFQYFVPTFFLFKFFIAFSFIGSVFFLYKILQKLSPQTALLGTAFFALNPFVIIESLVSAHNDIVMIFFILLGIHRLINKKFVTTFLLFIFAYGIKFAAASFPFPINPIFLHSLVILLLGAGMYLFARMVKKDEKKAYNLLFFVTLLLMIGTIILATYRTTFQPWYLLPVLPFAAFFVRYVPVILMSIIISLIALLNYLPYLYLGNWDPPVPLILMFLNIVGLVIAGIIGIVFSKKKLYA